MRLPRVAALFLAIGLLAPAAARADSTLSLAFGEQYILASVTAGEVNDYLVAYDPMMSEWVFTERAAGELLDTGVVVGCSGDGTAELRCPAAGIRSIVLRPGPGNDEVAGAAGLPVGSHFYAMQGDSGNDTLDGANFGDLEVLGDDGNDTITPARARRGTSVTSSFITPGTGNDTVLESVIGTRVVVFASTAPDGIDVMRGGAGFDEAEYETRPDRVGLSADGVANDGAVGEGDNIAPSVEALRGGDGNDLLVASNLVDSQLSGYDGNDELRGGNADDVLFGGLDDDRLDGGGGDDLFPGGDRLFVAVGGGPAELGADSFTGGAGTDRLEYHDRSGPVTIRLNGQADDGEASEGDNIAADIETLVGGDAGDTIVATAGAQRIFGGPGPDTIDDGGGAGDYVRGEGHDDTLLVRDGAADDAGCGSGADTLIADDVDASDGTCEAVDAQATPKPDTSAPAVALSGCKRKLKRKRFLRGVRCTVAANESATWTVVLLARARRARIAARYNLELARTTFSGTGQALRLRAPRKLVRGSRRFRVRLEITARDAAGNATSLKRTIRVR